MKKKDFEKIMKSATKDESSNYEPSLEPLKKIYIGYKDYEDDSPVFEDSIEDFYVEGDDNSCDASDISWIRASVEDILELVDIDTLDDDLIFDFYYSIEDNHGSEQLELKIDHVTNEYVYFVPAD